MAAAFRVVRIPVPGGTAQGGGRARPARRCDRPGRSV